MCLYFSVVILFKRYQATIVRKPPLVEGSVCRIGIGQEATGKVNDRIAL